MVRFLYLLDFEVDPVESASNLRTHGIAFVDAQSLWQHPNGPEVPARFTDCRGCR